MGKIDSTFTACLMRYYAMQIAMYCNSQYDCDNCTFRDKKKKVCKITGRNDKETAPYNWSFGEELS